MMVHAENAEMIDVLQKQTLKEGITAPIGRAISCPPVVEEAVSRATYFAKLADAPIYIIHVAAQGAMEIIRDRFAKGVNVTGETCTHYLIIARNKLDLLDFEGAKYVSAPALGTKEHLDTLLAGVKKMAQCGEFRSRGLQFCRSQAGGKGGLHQDPQRSSGAGKQEPGHVDGRSGERQDQQAEVRGAMLRKSGQRSVAFSPKRDHRCGLRRGHRHLRPRLLRDLHQ